MNKMTQALMLSLVLLIAGCSSSGFEAQTDWEVEQFSYTNQRGEAVSLESLKGTPWIAAFIFTNCETVCPPMTFNLTEVQAALVEKGLEDYRIVAFSVDPSEDTPEKLTEYLANFPIPDESKWNLLTGYDQEELGKLAMDSFKVLVQDDPNSDQVIHGTSFYLVDPEGTVVKNYDGYQDVPVDTIAVDIETLIEEQS